MRKKIPALGLALVYFWTHVITAHAAEADFWRQRRATAQRQAAERPADVPLLARLPSVMAALPDFRSAGTGPLPTTAEMPAWLSDRVLPHGAVREIHLSKKPGAPLIVHIQDVHGHEEAQRQIAAIVSDLGEAAPSKLLVGLEGASGPFRLAPYRAWPDAGVVRMLADYFLKKGYIGGAEHAGLTMKEPPLLRGLEDRDLYLANVRALTDAARLTKTAEERLAALSRALGPLKDRVYSPALRRHDERAEAYRNGKSGLGAYVRSLAETVPASAPNLRLFLKALDGEARLDLARVEQDRRRLIQDLAARLPEQALSDLTERGLLYRAGRLTYGDFYQDLERLCRAHGLDLARYGQMGPYMEYVRAADRINRNAFLGELSALEESVERALAQTPAQKQLARAARDAGLLAKLLRQEMTPEDWSAYENRRAEVLALDARLKALGSAVESPAVSLAPFEDFCRLALRRNGALAGNLLSALSAADAPPLAVLVAGGFHTDGLTAVLRAKDASYVVITPRVSALPEGRYLDVFARDPEPLEKFFAGEPISLLTERALTESAPATPAGRRGLHVVDAATVVFPPTIQLARDGFAGADQVLKQAERLARDGQYRTVRGLDLELSNGGFPLACALLRPDTPVRPFGLRAARRGVPLPRRPGESRVDLGEVSLSVRPGPKPLGVPPFLSGLAAVDVGNHTAGISDPGGMLAWGLLAAIFVAYVLVTFLTRAADDIGEEPFSEPTNGAVGVKTIRPRPSDALIFDSKTNVAVFPFKSLSSGQLIDIARQAQARPAAPKKETRRFLKSVEHFLSTAEGAAGPDSSSVQAIRGHIPAIFAFLKTDPQGWSLTSPDGKTHKVVVVLVGGGSFTTQDGTQASWCAALNESDQIITLYTTGDPQGFLIGFAGFLGENMEPAMRGFLNTRRPRPSGGDIAFFGLALLAKSVVIPILDATTPSMLPQLARTGARTRLGSTSGSPTPIERVISYLEMNLIGWVPLYNAMNILDFSDDPAQDEHQRAVSRALRTAKRFWKDVDLTATLTNRRPPEGTVPDLDLGKLVLRDSTHVVLHAQVLEDFERSNEPEQLDRFLVMILLHEQLARLGLPHNVIAEAGFEWDHPVTLHMTSRQLARHARRTWEVFMAAGPSDRTDRRAWEASLKERLAGPFARTLDYAAGMSDSLDPRPRQGRASGYPLSLDRFFQEFGRGAARKTLSFLGLKLEDIHPNSLKFVSAVRHSTSRRYVTEWRVRSRRGEDYTFLITEADFKGEQMLRDDAMAHQELSSRSRAVPPARWLSRGRRGFMAHLPAFGVPLSAVSLPTMDEEVLHAIMRALGNLHRVRAHGNLLLRVDAEDEEKRPAWELVENNVHILRERSRVQAMFVKFKRAEDRPINAQTEADRVMGALKHAYPWFFEETELEEELWSTYHHERDAASQPRLTPSPLRVIRGNARGPILSFAGGETQVQATLWRPVLFALLAAAGALDWWGLAAAGLVGAVRLSARHGHAPWARRLALAVAFLTVCLAPGFLETGPTWDHALHQASLALTLSSIHTLLKMWLESRGLTFPFAAAIRGGSSSSEVPEERPDWLTAWVGEMAGVLKRNKTATLRSAVLSEGLAKLPGHLSEVFLIVSGSASSARLVYQTAEGQWIQWSVTQATRRVHPAAVPVSWEEDKKTMERIWLAVQGLQSGVGALKALAETKEKGSQAHKGFTGFADEIQTFIDQVNKTFQTDRVFSMEEVARFVRTIKEFADLAAVAAESPERVGMPRASLTGVRDLFQALRTLAAGAKESEDQPLEQTLNILRENPAYADPSRISLSQQVPEAALIGQPATVALLLWHAAAALVEAAGPVTTDISREDDAVVVTFRADQPPAPGTWEGPLPLGRAAHRAYIGHLAPLLNAEVTPQGQEIHVRLPIKVSTPRGDDSEASTKRKRLPKRQTPKVTPPAVEAADEGELRWIDTVTHIVQSDEANACFVYKEEDLSQADPKADHAEPFARVEGRLALESLPMGSIRVLGRLSDAGELPLRGPRPRVDGSAGGMEWTPLPGRDGWVEIHITDHIVRRVLSTRGDFDLPFAVLRRDGRDIGSFAGDLPEEDLPLLQRDDEIIGYAVPFSGTAALGGLAAPLPAEWLGEQVQLVLSRITAKNNKVQIEARMTGSDGMTKVVEFPAPGILTDARRRFANALDESGAAPEEKRAFLWVFDDMVHRASNQEQFLEELLRGPIHTRIAPLLQAIQESTARYFFNPRDDIRLDALLRYRDNYPQTTQAAVVDLFYPGDADETKARALAYVKFRDNGRGLLTDLHDILGDKPAAWTTRMDRIKSFISQHTSNAGRAWDGDKIKKEMGFLGNNQAEILGNSHWFAQFTRFLNRIHPNLTPQVVKIGDIRRRQHGFTIWPVLALSLAIILLFTHHGPSLDDMAAWLSEGPRLARAAWMVISLHPLTTAMAAVPALAFMLWLRQPPPPQPARVEPDMSQPPLWASATEPLNLQDAGPADRGALEALLNAAAPSVAHAGGSVEIQMNPPVIEWRVNGHLHTAAGDQSALRTIETGLIAAYGLDRKQLPPLAEDDRQYIHELNALSRSGSVSDEAARLLGIPPTQITPADQEAFLHRLFRLLEAYGKRGVPPSAFASLLKEFAVLHHLQARGRQAGGAAFGAAGAGWQDLAAGDLERLLKVPIEANDFRGQPAEEIVEELRRAVENNYNAFRRELMAREASAVRFALDLREGRVIVLDVPEIITPDFKTHLQALHAALRYGPDDAVVHFFSRTKDDAAAFKTMLQNEKTQFAFFDRVQWVTARDAQALNPETGLVELSAVRRYIVGEADNAGVDFFTSNDKGLDMADRDVREGRVVVRQLLAGGVVRVLGAVAEAIKRVVFVTLQM